MDKRKSWKSASSLSIWEVVFARYGKVVATDASVVLEHVASPAGRPGDFYVLVFSFGVFNNCLTLV